ncbi:MAG: hypothetical protein L6406_08805, partial [Desulfobacterales bacterium]|nr:hypothetical protein [Desulfobacterales bacterium]
MSRGSPLESLAKAILIGDRSEALQTLGRAIEAGFGVEEIVVKCVLKAHIDFGEWYERDPAGSLKAWDSCFLTSLESTEFYNGLISGSAILSSYFHAHLSKHLSEIRIAPFVHHPTLLAHT